MVRRTENILATAVILHLISIKDFHTRPIFPAFNPAPGLPHCSNPRGLSRFATPCLKLANSVLTILHANHLTQADPIWDNGYITHSSCDAIFS
jgi:hypothetical protein